MGSVCAKCCGREPEPELRMHRQDGLEMNVAAQIQKLNRASNAKPATPDWKAPKIPQAEPAWKNKGAGPASIQQAPATQKELTQRASTALPKSSPSNPTPPVQSSRPSSKASSSQQATLVQPIQTSSRPSVREESSSPRPSTEPGTGGQHEDDEAVVSRWLETLSGSILGDMSFGEWLKDGRVLCKTLNAIKPGIVKQINDSPMPFKQMENVSAVIKACRELGVMEKDVFSTVDLYEAKNLKSVQRCMFSLSGVLRSTVPSFKGPWIGIQQKAFVKDEKRADFSVTQDMGFRKDIVQEVREGTTHGRRM